MSRKKQGHKGVYIELLPLTIARIKYLAKLRKKNDVDIYRDAVDDHLQRLSACFPKSKRS
jgi:hypothetical protein